MWVTIKGIRVNTANSICYNRTKTGLNIVFSGGFDGQEQLPNIHIKMTKEETVTTIEKLDSCMNPCFII